MQVRIARPDDTECAVGANGEIGTAGYAVVVLRVGQSAGDEELMAHCRSLIGDWGGQPRRWLG